MKPPLLALVLAFAASAFALELPGQGGSWGVGVSASPYSETAEVKLDSNYSERVFRTMHYSVFGYYDATYVQATAGFGWSSPTAATRVVDGLGVLGGASDSASTSADAATYLALSLVGKYPFDMDGFYVFPALGVEYDLNLGYRSGSGRDLKRDMSSEEKTDLNMLWLKLGCGLDIPLAGRLYLRPEVLAAYKIPSKLERDWVRAESKLADSAYWRTIKVDVGLLAGWTL